MRFVEDLSSGRDAELRLLGQRRKMPVPVPGSRPLSLPPPRMTAVPIVAIEPPITMTANVVLRRSSARRSTVVK